LIMILVSSFLVSANNVITGDRVDNLLISLIGNVYDENEVNSKVVSNTEIPTRTVAPPIFVQNTEIPMVGVTRSPLFSPSPTSETNTNVISTPKTATPVPTGFINDYTYYDSSLCVTIETHTESYVSGSRTLSLTYYVVDLQLSSANQLGALLAGGGYDGGKEYTSVMASRVDAILAINGDYYDWQGKKGIMIREGVLYRNTPTDRPLLIIDKYGNFSVVKENTVDANELVAQGVLHTFAFGPALVVNGTVAPVDLTGEIKDYDTYNEPRMAIGQVGELHYKIICVDGRQPGYSDYGVTIKKLSKICLEQGCKTAYNLDGGSSATLYFNGRIYNSPSGYSGYGTSAGDEREISDIIYFTSGIN